jgi:hypothetical protein
VNWNVCRNRERAGFTYPSYGAWMSALGPRQLDTLHECYAARWVRPLPPPAQYSPSLSVHGTRNLMRWS